MKKLFKFAVILSAILFISCTSTKSQKNDVQFKLNPDVLEGQLDNGMSYYILENAYPENRISLRLVVKVGSIAEQENELGVAHLIEHMCFNGTEHFEKNTLVDYAESIGMDFGAEVNAYTSFEETVYKLEIPADNPEFIDTALLIFHDWASAVTFDPEELDKERGVVTEEWRGRLGLSGRLTDTVLPFELADSSYVGKLPIGSMDVIANITRDEVVAFYEKWYQPQNMAVIISGALDPATIEGLVKKNMGNIPAATKKNTLEKGFVPARTQKDILVFADPEWPYSQVQLVALDEDNKPMTTEADLRRYYLTRIVDEVMNNRFSEITTDPQAPWLMAQAINYTETHSATFDGLVFVPKDGMMWDAFARVLDEVDRALLFGITSSEFERTRDSLLATENQWYETSETTDSQSRVSGLVDYFLTGETFMSDDDFIAAARKILASITLDEVNARAQDIFEGRGMLGMFYIPEAYAGEMPSKEEIIDFWENYKSEAEMTAYEDTAAQSSIMERPATKATVASKKALTELGATDYELSNGVRVIIKKTDFDKSVIFMSALSKGGASLVSDSEYASAIFSPYYTIYSGIGGMDINQLQKFLSDKTIGINCVLDERDEKIVGQASPTELELLLQLVNRMIAAPQFSDIGWNYSSLMLDTQAKQYGVQPSDVWAQKISQVLYGDSVRHSVGINPELVAAYNRQDAERLFKERFGNAADFTFVFCGDLDEQNVLDLCCYYLGSLPGNTKAREEGKYEPFTFPKGITKEVVKKGQDEKGQVFIAFGGNLPASKSVDETYKDIALLEQLRALVDIRLREIIREDKSGTYGVNVYKNMDGYPERYFEFQISFGCEPAREQELTDEVIAAINTLRSELVDQTYIEKINESYRRNFEANQTNSSWWIDILNAIEVLTYMPVEAACDPAWVTDITTAKAMKDLAVKYLDTSNYVAVYLEPEK
ncbi:MAG: insulinase family protein [Treponema sp.]|nr:insulinase family protein [Treponema sp.]